MSKIMLGKLPAKVDSRTIKMRDILKLKLLPDLPVYFNVDESLGGIYDDRMFLNDVLGDCVIAAQAHQILRFEKFEQEKIITITDEEVRQEYLRQTGGLDSGLYLLNSLKEWRKTGWPAGGNVHLIYAFASVEWGNHLEVKHCIHLLGGVNYGMKVPQSAIDQFKAGEPWTVVTNDGGNQGGHGVYLFHYLDQLGYDQNGVTCMTWGRRQFMTWGFWDRYVDECYGIVDNRDSWVKDSPVDVEKLDGYLHEITGDGEEESTCPLARGYVGFGNVMAKLVGSDTRIPQPRRKVRS